MLPSRRALVKTSCGLSVWQNHDLMGLEDAREKGEELVPAHPTAKTLEEAIQRTCSGRRVLVTGSTGFVGSWLAYLLATHGATVVGLSLPVPLEARALRHGVDRPVRSVIGDVNNFATVLGVVKDYEPEIIFHLAAQALVLPSYEQPLATMATNIMGTANVLEALRLTGCSLSCVVVTSDKCYAVSPRDSYRPHNETDPLGGSDPYSASKAGAEIVTSAYWQSFGGTSLRAIATARAGNILGGGDWAIGRIVPDWARSILASSPLYLRQPEAVRPWQHVLDAIAGYVLLADALAAEPARYAGAWNFGPPGTSATTVQELIEMFQRAWTAQTGQTSIAINSATPSNYENRNAQDGEKERLFLALDSGKARDALGWSQRLDLTSTVEWTTEWYARALRGPRTDLAKLTEQQINRYIELCGAVRTSETG